MIVQTRGSLSDLRLRDSEQVWGATWSGRRNNGLCRGKAPHLKMWISRLPRRSAEPWLLWHGWGEVFVRDRLAARVPPLG